MGGLLHLVQRGGDRLGGAAARQSPHRCTKCNQPTHQRPCSNHRIAVRCSAVLMCPLKSQRVEHYGSIHSTVYHSMYPI